MSNIKLMLCCLLSLLLLGCAAMSKQVNKYYMQEDSRYLSSQDEHPLIVPPGLSRARLQPIYPIPDVPAKRVEVMSLVPPGSPSVAIEQKLSVRK